MLPMTSWLAAGEAPGEAGVVGSGVEMHRLVRPAMHAAVGLLVADETFRAEFERAVHRPCTCRWGGRIREADGCRQ
jgi:hypothetical protein